MSTTLCKSFHYDFVLSLDAHEFLISPINNFLLQHKGKQILGLTYNHRLYNIHEKNLIKGFIDNFDVDHLMFSIRPSSINIVKQLKKIDLNKFRNLVQLFFILQSMARYDIEFGVVSSKYLSIDTRNNIDALEAFSLLEKYLAYLEEEIKTNFPRINFSKSFCSLTSLNKLKSNLSGKKIIILNTSDNGDVNVVKRQFTFENQITELEKDIFWIGFDSSFKEVPWEKKYPITKWTEIKESSSFGEGLYENELKYCTRCCLPETMEGMLFDEFGICTPCRLSEEKMHINWEEREATLSFIINDNKSASYYDCLLPMSGGKDSMFQAYILTHKYNLQPLAVTHGANWMSLSGRYNLENCLQKFDLDHIIFHSKRSTINKAARKSLTAIGDACWHCHIGAGTFVIQTALNWGLELMIWGESISERDARGSYINQTEASLFYNLEISGRIKAEDYKDESLSESELSKWFYPDKEKLKSSKIKYLHLGDYIFWDEEKQVEFVVKNFEWMNSKVENAFKGYKSTECVMAGVHDYANFIKRGIGRATVQASDDIRRGIITREDGIELAKEYDTQRPHALDFYLSITDYSEDDFERILIEARKLSKDAMKLNNLEKNIK
jgi:N-acetyl sugar amidotransferase